MITMTKKRDRHINIPISEGNTYKGARFSRVRGNLIDDQSICPLIMLAAERHADGH
jgi:hypothetical protein